MQIDQIHFHFENVEEDSSYDALKPLCLEILQENQKSGELNVIFTDGILVRSLNKEYRKLDKTTDVLSFPWEEESFLGEIYIDIQQVSKQAPRYNNSFFQELQRIFVHGVLHICGFDHKKSIERTHMRSLEDQWANWQIKFTGEIKED